MQMRPPSLLILLFSTSHVFCQAPLRFGTFQAAPFTMRKQECWLDDGKRECAGNRAFEGVCVELMALLAREMGTEYRIEIRRNAGSLQDDGTWDGLIGDLNNSVVDVAIAPITVTPERSEVVDFSPPFHASGISVMMKKPTPKGVKLRSLNPFATTTWIAIVLLQCMAIGTSFALHAQSKKAEAQGQGRLRSGIWIVFVLLVFACDFGLIAAFIRHLCTVSASNAQVQPIREIESAEELVAQGNVSFGMQKDGATHQFFRQSNNTLHRKMLETMERNGESSFVVNIAQGIERVRQSDGDFAFVLDDSANAYENSRRPCDTGKIGQNLATYQYAVATDKGSSLSGRVHSAIESLRSSGEINKVIDHWFTERSQCAKLQMEDRPEADRYAGCLVYVMITSIVLASIASLIAAHLEKKRAMHPVKFVEEEVLMPA